MAKPTLLTVDDDPEVLAAVARDLRSHYGDRYRVVRASSGAEALDAVEKGGGGMLRIRTAPDGPGVRVEIADDGPPIPPEVQARIWEPFFTTKPVGAGTGLGLDIARRIVVRGHGGQIRVRSEPGDTRFTVVLPREPHPAAG